MSKFEVGDLVRACRRYYPATTALHGELWIVVGLPRDYGGIFTSSKSLATGEVYSLRTEYLEKPDVQGG